MSEDERLLAIPIPADQRNNIWDERDVQMYYMQQAIRRLREGLTSLYRELHDDEFECPNHLGECFCGLVKQNSAIDFYLDPSRPREEYLAQRTREAVIERLNFLYEEVDKVMELWNDGDLHREWSLDNLNVMLNLLLEAQPWLIEGVEDEPG